MHMHMHMKTHANQIHRGARAKRMRTNSLPFCTAPCHFCRRVVRGRGVVWVVRQCGRVFLSPLQHHLPPKSGQDHADPGREAQQGDRSTPLAVQCPDIDSAVELACTGLAHKARAALSGLSGLRHGRWCRFAHPRAADARVRPIFFSPICNAIKQRQRLVVCGAHRQGRTRYSIVLPVSTRQTLPSGLSSREASRRPAPSAVRSVCAWG